VKKVMGLAGRGARFARPYAEAVRAADATAREGGRVGIIPGDPDQTEALRRLLGGPDAGPSEDALALLAVTADTDLSAGRETLARRRHSGGRALAIVVGDPAAGPAVEARLLEGHLLEPSNVAHTPSLHGEGARTALQAIVRTLGDDASAAARQYPALRHAVSRDMVERASRRAGIVGTLPLPGVDLPALALIQVRLVAELAALHDRPGGAERVAEAAAVVGAGFGWRALARSASGLVPGVGWAVRGTVAYGATRAVGEAALVRAQAGHDMFEGELVDRIRPALDRVLERFRR
jgi:uncharacterized protein (DUF697 family)